MGIASVYMALGTAGREAAEAGKPLREAWREFRQSYGFDEVMAMIERSEAKEIFSDSYKAVRVKNKLR